MQGIEELGTKWKIMLENGEKRILTDKLEIVIIEIPKAKKILKKDKNNKIAQWMMFLDNPNCEEVSKIMEENKEIKEAVEELEKLSEDEELRRLAFLKEKYIRDENSARAYFREQGLTEGLAKGEAKAKKDDAKKMLEKGISIDIITEITGLTKEEIQKL